MKPLYIFDLDGTLALIDHRRHILDDRDDPQRWRRFYAACDKDAPNYPVISTMERLRRFADIWIFSGRSDEVREQTVNWLLQYTSFSKDDFDAAFGYQDVLTMRSESDHTPDDVLKRRWFDAMLDEDRRRLVATFDDRDRIVRMWRGAGVTCFQVADGDF